MNIKKNPEILFSRYTEGWHEFRGDEIFRAVSEKNHPNLPLLSASQVNGMVYREDIGVDIKYNEESTINYKRVLPGQFVIHLRSFQGGFAYSNIEGITSPAYTVLDFRNKQSQSALFWKYVLSSNTFIKRLEAVTYGIRDGRSISFKDFSSLKFRIPGYSEQVKIGTFFHELDKLIELQKLNIDNLKELKKGFLQRMFLTENEVNPLIRFNDYKGEWRECKLSDVSNSLSKADLPSTFFYIDLESVEGTSLVKAQEINREDAPSRAQRVAKKGDIFYQTVRPYQKNNYLFNLEGEYVFSTGYAQIRPSVNSEFLFSYVQQEKFVNEVLRKSTGTSFPAISTKELFETKVNIPIEVEEQVVIGNYFKQLDELIELETVELKYLQEMKKGFLQKMLI